MQATDIDRKHVSTRMSKIVRHGGVVYLCGQTSSGTEIKGIEEQTQEVLRRIDTLLSQAGSDRTRILSALIHLKDIGDFEAMNSVWEAWMPPGCAPARTTVQAQLALDSLKVEVTVTAATT